MCQDIIQARPSRFPITSEDLFSIFDDASEKTFLCGNALSMQKFIFDGEAGKVGLETKNLVACASFMLEQKLVLLLSAVFNFSQVLCIELHTCLFLLEHQTSKKLGW